MTIDYDDCMHGNACVSVPMKGLDGLSATSSFARLRDFQQRPGTLHTHAYTLHAHAHAHTIDRWPRLDTRRRFRHEHTNVPAARSPFSLKRRDDFSPLGPTSVGKDGLEVLQDAVRPERWRIGRV